MSDNYPDPSTPFLSEADVIRHLGSPYYSQDSHFRAICEQKLSLGVPGATTLEAGELGGRVDAMTPATEAQIIAEEERKQHFGELTVGGLVRLTLPTGATMQASGEAAQRAREADKQQ